MALSLSFRTVPYHSNHFPRPNTRHTGTPLIALLLDLIAATIHRYQTDLVSVLRKMGYTAAANVATPDGVAVADVAVAVTPNAGLRAASTASASPGTSSTSSMDSGDGAAAATAATADSGLGSGAAAAAAAAPAPAAPRLLALELVGRHNSAANSPRIMGEAVIKYRLLQVGGRPRVL